MEIDNSDEIGEKEDHEENEENEENEEKEDDLEQNSIKEQEEITVFKNGLYLQKIEEIKTPEYDKIISNLYYDVDIFNKNNFVNKIQKKFLADLFEKMNRTMVSEEICETQNIITKKKNSNKKKNKKRKNKNKIRNDGMGLLLSLEVPEPMLLYHPYQKITKNNEEKIIFFFYSINVNSTKNINHGFIFPLNLGKSIKIKLIDHRTHEISYSKLKKIKRMSIDKSKMKSLISYHYYTCLNLLQGKKNIKNE